MYLLKVGSLDFRGELTDSPVFRLTMIAWRHTGWPLYVGADLEALKRQLEQDVQRFTEKARRDDYRIDEQAYEGLARFTYTVDVYEDDGLGRFHTDKPHDQYHRNLPDL